MKCSRASFTADQDVAFPGFLSLANGAKELEHRTVTVVDRLVSKASEIQTRELASESVALVIASMFVAKGSLAPWTRPPVHAFSRAAVSAPVHVGLGQFLINGWMSSGTGRRAFKSFFICCCCCCRFFWLSSYRRLRSIDNLTLLLVAASYNKLVFVTATVRRLVRLLVVIFFFSVLFFHLAE